MSELDTRWLSFAIWGVGTLAMAVYALAGDYRQWKRIGDRRAIRELSQSVALFVVAIASTTAVFMVLFGEAGTTIRQLLTAMALGAFTVLAAVRASDVAGREHDG